MGRKTIFLLISYSFDSTTEKDKNKNVGRNMSNLCWGDWGV